jgi:ribosomal protein S12 methylthiotransferase
MRRGITAQRMLDIIARLRDARPGVTLRTTVLVGFPGETEAAFANLLAFVEEAGFDRLGVFTYSAEEGTPAIALPGAVPAELMAERARQVQDLQDRLAWPRQKALYGTRQTVLVDGPSPDSAFPLEGRTAGQAPEIDGVVLLRGRRLRPGRFAEVSIVGRGLRARRRIGPSAASIVRPSWPPVSSGPATRRSRRARSAASSPWSSSGSCPGRPSACWSR